MRGTENTRESNFRLASFMNSIPRRAGAEVLVFSKGVSVGILCVEEVVEWMSLGSKVCIPVR